MESIEDGCLIADIEICYMIFGIYTIICIEYYRWEDQV